MTRASGLLGAVVLLAGCASAGGQHGIFDISAAWYKHPVTGDVKECDVGFYPGAQIVRYRCGKALIEQGYVEVRKCKDARPGDLCVTAIETGDAPPQGPWVLWGPVLGPDGQPLPGQWSPLRGYDLRAECEAAAGRRADGVARCLPTSVDPRSPRP